MRAPQQKYLPEMPYVQKIDQEPLPLRQCGVDSDFCTDKAGLEDDSYRSSDLRRLSIP